MDRLKNIYIDLFENPIGRITRADFWLITIFQFCVLIFVAFVFPSAFILGVTYLFYFVSGVLFQIKRYHDSGRKGWWILVPLANFIFLFYNSTDDNEWGLKPNNIDREY